LLGCKGKNKAKTAVSVAVQAKPEVEIWRRPQNQLFDPGFLFTPSDSFSIGRTILPQYKMLHRRQTTQCTKGMTDSTVGQKSRLLNADCFQQPKLSA